MATNVKSELHRLIDEIIELSEKIKNEKDVVKRVELLSELLSKQSRLQLLIAQVTSF